MEPASQARFLESLLLTSQAIIYVFDVVGGRNVYISERGATILGLVPADIVGRDEEFVRDFVHPADRDSVFDRLAALADRPEGTVIESEYRLRAADGTWRRVLDLQTVLARLPDGSVHVLGSAVDVTARREVEDELELVSARLEDVLRESATILFRTAPASPFAITFVSENVQSTLGWSPAALLADPSFFLSHVHPDDRTYLEESTRAIIARGFGTFEFRFQTPDGTYRWLRDVLRIVHDASGRPKEIVGSCIDITLHKRVEEQLHRSERLAAIGTLAAGIAHEINNPAASIVMSAELALASGAPSETVRRCLEDIVAEGKRCGSIVKGILQFTRNEPTEKWRTDLNLVVRRVADHERGWVESRDAHLETRLAAELPVVIASPVQLEQVVSNLVRNAVEAGARHVLVATTRGAGEELRLVVEDDGPGIAEDVRPHIFDPFFTTRRTLGGTGLGLSMCHGIVAEHGGRIEVGTAVTGGTTIAVTLPVAPFGTGAPA